MENSQKALEYLANACNREPANTRAFRNYALALQKAGKNEMSIEIINKDLE